MNFLGSFTCTDTDSENFTNFFNERLDTLHYLINNRYLSRLKNEKSGLFNTIRALEKFNFVYKVFFPSGEVGYGTGIVNFRQVKNDNPEFVENTWGEKIRKVEYEWSIHSKSTWDNGWYKEHGNPSIKWSNIILWTPKIIEKVEITIID